MRHLHHQSGLTYREIADKSFVSHTNLSQNADGRLTRNFHPVKSWFNALYEAADAYDIDMTPSKDDALAQARSLWQACTDHQHHLRRPTPPAAPPPHPPTNTAFPAREGEAVLRPRSGRPEPSRDVRHPRQPETRSRRRISQATIQMPGTAKDYTKRVTPSSLYEATSVSDLVASLNDMLIEAGYDMSRLFRRNTPGRPPAKPDDRLAVFDDQVREVLRGKRFPTPGIIRRIVTACGGTRGDQVVWDSVASPLLAQLPPRGRASVNPPPQRG
jgi:hypothetical protein